MSGGNAVQTVPSRDEVIADVGSWLADTVDAIDALSPHDAALRSNAVTSGRASVEEIEARIRAARGLPPVGRAGAA